MMQRVTRVCQRKLSYLYENCSKHSWDTAVLYLTGQTDEWRNRRKNGTTWKYNAFVDTVSWWRRKNVSDTGAASGALGWSERLGSKGHEPSRALQAQESRRRGVGCGEGVSPSLAGSGLGRGYAPSPEIFSIFELKKASFCASGCYFLQLINLNGMETGLGSLSVIEGYAKKCQ